MNLKALTVGRADRAWHEPFFRYVAHVFPSLDFGIWYEQGCWDDDYVCFCLADGGEIVANASLSSMQITIEGEVATGWQLGAVGVVPAYRGRGLMNQLMPRLLASTAEDAFLFLFANEDVLGFYPKYGFRPVPEAVFGATCMITPSGPPLRRLSIERAEDMALVRRLAAETVPVTERFGALRYGETLIWYWANFFRGDFYYAEREQAVVIAEQEGNLLRVCDVLAAAHRPALRTLLPRIARTAVSRLEFAFTPELYFPEASALRATHESPLFVRGARKLPTLPFKFPLLAQG
jgi:GNAT superfamily N-acetyltransferase